MFLQVSVILFTGGWGAWSGGWGVSALGGAWSGGGSAPRGVPGGGPRPGRPLQRTVCILLECILVSSCDLCEPAGGVEGRVGEDGFNSLLIFALLKGPFTPSVSVNAVTTL